MIEVEVTRFVANEGTIVLLEGETETGTVIFGCEPRYALDILAAIDDGEMALALVPPYMVWNER